MQGATDIADESPGKRSRWSDMVSLFTPPQPRPPLTWRLISVAWHPTATTFMTALSAACAVLLIVGTATGWPIAVAAVLAGIAFAGFVLLATVAISWLWHYVRPPRHGPWQ